MPISHTLIIPIYHNEEFLPEVLQVVQEIASRTAAMLEVIFVVDGSPDRSEAWLRAHLPAFPVSAQLITLSRNFGSFTAVRTGMGAARGEFIAVMAADLQEPPELMIDFFQSLAQGHDVVIGTRSGRDDPLAGQFSARLFWRLYRFLVQPEIPASGVDVFAVSRRARDALLQLDEAHSSLIAQLFWIGFPRAEVPYERRARKYGSSGWTWRKKAKYLLDSIFSFTAIPITLLMLIGFAGTVGFMLLGVVLMGARALNWVSVPGYTAIMLTILFSASLILLGLGIVGSYVWRAYENTKRRPLGLVRERTHTTDLLAPTMDNVLDPRTKKPIMRRGMQLARFVAAGAANTLISIASYQALLFFMGHLPAYVLSYAVGVAIAYFLYTRHVFGARTSTRSFVLFAVFYVTAGLIGSLINAGLIDLMGWHARLAIFATVLAMLPVNYLGSRWCLLGAAAIDGGRT